MHFQLHPLKFTFVARDPIHFPPGKSSNILRGAFGTIFRRLACTPGCPGAPTCDLRATCPYARMFEPSALASGPSGFADWPRPFVFRATALDGQTIAPGAQFFFHLNLFDLHNPAIAHLEQSFTRLAEEGLGPRRGRAELVDVQSTLLTLSLDKEGSAVERVSIRFVTPTELKGDKQLIREPDFGILAARIRDRVSKLRELYGDGPLDLDFKAFGDRAAQIRMTRCDLNQVDATRRSSKTGQVHSIGGFIGEADYEGDLAEFVPYLRAAQWTGVGRQTVWGKGELVILPWQNAQ